MSSEQRFVDPTQPGPLKAAVYLSYLLAATTVLFLLAGALVRRGNLLFDLLNAASALLSIGQGILAIGIASSRKRAYDLSVLATIAMLLLDIATLVQFGIGVVLSFLLEVALLALLLHPSSRSHTSTWFS
jgi:hypothetical protein